MDVINVQKEKIIINLRITSGNQYTNIYKCGIEKSLEDYINDFIKYSGDDYSSSFPLVLYKGESYLGDKLKQHISQIIKPEDKMNKMMILLVYPSSGSGKHELDKINIILTIEDIKKEELIGIKGEAIKDIINKSSIIKIDLKWCTFKYKGDEIDIDKKFDEIANNEDKNKLEIIITVNYKIPS